MPELPEVEINARIARRALERGVITRVTLKPCKLFRAPRAHYPIVETGEHARSTLISDSTALSEALLGARASHTCSSRVGKLMALHLITADERALTLFVRLGMTGQFYALPPREPPPNQSETETRRGVKLTLEIDAERTLHFVNTRMFGAVWALCSGPLNTKERLDIEAIHAAQWRVEFEQSGMGPDALALARDPKTWVKRLRARASGRSGTRPIKSVLLDQKVIAGVGNIYAAEGIFNAGAHPLTPIHALSEAQLRLIAEGVAESMEHTLSSADHGTDLVYGSARGEASPFKVYGRAELPCARCASLLVNLVISGRATVYCPTCQAQP